MDKNYTIYLNKILIPLEAKKKEYKGRVYFQDSEIKKYKHELKLLEDEVELREIKEFTPDEEKEIKRLETCIRIHLARLKEYTEKKENIVRKMDAYNRDEYKEEISEKIQEDFDKIKQKFVDKKKRILKKKDDKKIRQKWWVEQRKKWKYESRQRYYKYKEMDRSYRHYLKASGQFPHYLQKKLNKMPENKGYIWKGIYFFGLKPTEKKYPLRMFERTYDKKLLIHEYTETYHRVYEKDQKRRREILIFERTRRKKHVPTLKQYLKS